MWTEYFCDNDQTHTIKSHSDFFGWGEMFTLLFMYLGTRFLGLIHLDELLLQSVLGKNLRRHQPFDYDEELKLSAADDPRSIADQSTQNVLAHWIPRFIEDSFSELVLEHAKDTHTITYKDPDAVLAPTLVKHFEDVYKLKQKPRDKYGQTSIGEFKHMLESEKQSDDGNVRSYIAIPQADHRKDYHEKFEHHFKLALQASPHVIQERMSRARNIQIKTWPKSMQIHSIIEYIFLFSCRFLTSVWNRYRRRNMFHGRV